MSKNIKISKRQYKMLQEADDNLFPYVTDDDSKNYDGYNNITANGKIDGETPANVTIGDKIQQMRTIDGWKYRTYGNLRPATMSEGVEVDQSNDFYDVKGFENDDLDLLTNDEKNDDLEQIPVGITKRLDNLLQSIKHMNLSPRKQGIILKKIVKELDCETIPYQWKKELIYMLK